MPDQIARTNFSYRWYTSCLCDLYNKNTAWHTLIAIALLLSVASKARAQCSVSLSGSPCVGSTITATFSGGTPAVLSWQKSGITVSNVYPGWNSSATTVAGSTSGISGNSAALLNTPGNVFVDATGNIYVADATNNRVQEFTSGSTNATTVAGNGTSGSGPNQLNHPIGVFVDNSGNIYVADAGNNRIQKWAPHGILGTTVAGSSSGTSGSSSALLNYPVGVYVDDSSNIFIADYGNHRIQKWTSGSSTGSTVAGISGSAGIGANQLNHPAYVIKDISGNLYIADAGNNRVQKWLSGAHAGNTIAGKSNGTLGAGQGYLSHPRALFLDGYKNLYIADSGNNRIQRWASTDTIGTTLVGSSSGSSGSTAILLNTPMGVYVSSNGNLYVGDARNNRVQKFSINTIYTYTPSTAGIYTLSYTTLNACIGFSSSYTIYNLPTAGIVSPNTYLCAGSSSAISGVVTATGAWKVVLNSNDSVKGSRNTTSFNINVTPSLTYNYSVATLTDSVCSAQLSGLTGNTSITVYPVPTPVITSTNSAFKLCSGSSITLASDTGNYALSFNGSTQYASTPDATDLNFGSTTDFTIEAWIKYSSSQANGTGLICKATSGAITGWQLSLNGDKLSAQSNMMPTLTGITSLNDGNWHHIALTVQRSTTTASIYVDGNVEGSTGSVNGNSVSTHRVPPCL